VSRGTAQTGGALDLGGFLANTRHTTISQQTGPAPVLRRLRTNDLRPAAIFVALLTALFLLSMGWSWATTGSVMSWRNPSPPPGATQAIVFVLRPGGDPLATAQRIAGPDAYVRRGGQDHFGRWWFTVPLAPGTESMAMRAAHEDPLVLEASFVDWPDNRRM